MCQISTLSSGFGATITPVGTAVVGTAVEAAKQTETPEAGDRPIAPVSGRRILSIADALFEGPEKKAKEKGPEKKTKEKVSEKKT